MNDNEVVKRWVDRQKAVFELHKHMTTLDTAGVLFFGTVIEKFRPLVDVNARWNAALVFACFGVSLLVALCAMLVCSVRIGSAEDPNVRWSSSVIALESTLFLGGVVGIARYVVLG